MGCLPSRHEINAYKERRRETIREKRMSHYSADEHGYLSHPPRPVEDDSSGRSSPMAAWTEPDTYIPRIDPTLPRLR